MAIVEEKASSNLPLEIIEIILSKISSVKSMLRFKTVCKSWNNMISDPVFVRNHLENSPNNLFITRYRDTTNGTFSLAKFEGRKSHVETVPENIQYGCDIIVCECNGVLLLSDSWFKCKKYVLWNPSTRKERYLDPYIFDDGCAVSPGICYDPVTDDFKVVFIGKRTYAIYSCNNNSWTEKKGIQCIGLCPGIFVDGATYWVLISDTDIGELVYFDPRIDELKRLKKPEQLISEYDGLFISMACLRGKLCLYCTTRVGDDGTKIRIWINEDDKTIGNPNWKELITIEYPFWSIKQVCFVENEIVIRLDEQIFVYYSPSEKTFQKIEKTETDIDDRLLVPYRNSLYFPQVRT